MFWIVCAAMILGLFWVLLMKARFEHALKSAMRAYQALVPAAAEKKKKAEELLRIADSLHAGEEEADLTRTLLVAAEGDNSLNDQIRTESSLDRMMKELKKKLDLYPEVRADSGIRSLYNEIERLKPKLAHAVMTYNETAKHYDEMISRFPGIIVSRLFHFQPLALYERTEEENENLKVAF
ncbi:MAG TPA: hypothetical protein DHW39_05485 [Erysipelotrichaceae bacterium]|nr:hypothetical protein [Erysipelotrichaceae bacterium]